MKLKLPILFLAFSSLAFANGNRIPSQSAEAVAKGYANIATVSDASSIYFNPAGLANVADSDVLGNAYVLSTEYKHDGATAESTHFVPSMFAATRLTPNVVVGVGMYAPYGLASKWGHNTSFNTLATENSVRYETLAFGLGYKVTETLSFGFSVEANKNSTRLEQDAIPGVKSPIVIKGDDISPSFTVGLQWKPADKHQFAITYHSQTVFNLEGSTSITPLNFSGDNNFKWRYPDHVAAGYAYSPTDRWTFEVNYDWTNWDKTDSTTVNTTGFFPIAIPLNWKSSSYFNVGATYKATENLSLLGGVSYSTNSVEDETFSPALPDVSKYLLTTGAKYTVKKFTFVVALEVSPSESRTVSGVPVNTAGQTPNGKYESSLWSVSSSVNYRF